MIHMILIGVFCSDLRWPEVKLCLFFYSVGLRNTSFTKGWGCIRFMMAMQYFYHWCCFFARLKQNMKNSDF